MRLKKLSVAVFIAIAISCMCSAVFADFPNIWYFTQAQDETSTPGKLTLTYNPALGEAPTNGPYLIGADVSWINNTHGQHCYTQAMAHVSANHFTYAIDAMPGDSIDYFFTQHWMGQPQDFYGWAGTHQCHNETDTKWFTYVMGIGFEKKPYSKGPLVVEGSERYRNRHEDEWRFDHFSGNYFQNTALNYRLVDWGDSLMVFLFPSEPTNWSNGRFCGMSGYEILCDHDTYSDNRGSGDNGPPGGVFNQTTSIGDYSNLINPATGNPYGPTSNPFQANWNNTTYKVNWYVWLVKYRLAYGQYIDYELSAARTLSDGQLYYSEPQRYYIGLGRIDHKFQHPWANAAGEASINTVTFPEMAFTQHVMNVRPGMSSTFMKGKGVFDTDWKTGLIYNYATPFDCNGTPMSFPDTTHSPFFKAGIIGPCCKNTTCFFCHFMDGKGYPEDMFGSDPNITTLPFTNLQVAAADGSPADHPVFGPALQTHAIPPAVPQGKINITWDSVPGAYTDGTPFMLRKPKYSFSNLGWGVKSMNLDSVRVSPRYVPIMTGLGLLEAIDESTILSFVNLPGKAGTGIAGRPQRLNDYFTGPNSLGRFGWKCGISSLKTEVFACIAMDLGISNVYFSNQGYMGGASDPPELPKEVIDTLVMYVSLLAPPPRQMGKGYIIYDPKLANVTQGGAVWADKTLYKGEAFEEIWKDPSAIRGKDLFVKAKCDLCHIPAIRTGTKSDFEELKNIEIQPFTDMLLHDMGPEEADNGYIEGIAKPSEWRTAPLWGMQYVHYSNKVHLLMHDGRARNIAESILWHFGEGLFSRNAFLAMTAQERADLVRYTDYPFADRLPKTLKSAVVGTQNPVAGMKVTGMPSITCYPNPIRRMAMIRLVNFAPAYGDKVALSIYNMQGKRVYSQVVRPGQTAVAWNTVPYAPGKYVARLTANGKAFEKHLLVLR